MTKNTKFDKYYDDVYHYILPQVKYNKDIAKDICQQTMEKAIKSKTYVDKGVDKYWLFTMAKNIFIDTKRKEKQLKILSFDDPNTVLPLHGKIENTLHDRNNENLELIKRFILKLPKMQQEVIQLYYFESLTFKEMSVYKQESINTLLGRMFNAKKTLRKLFNIYYKK